MAVIKITGKLPLSLAIEIFPLIQLMQGHSGCPRRVLVDHKVPIHNPSSGLFFNWPMKARVTVPCQL